MPLGTKVGLTHAILLDGDQLPTMERAQGAQQPRHFSAHVCMWPNGRPSPLLISSLRCVIWCWVSAAKQNHLLCNIIWNTEKSVKYGWLMSNCWMYLNSTAMLGSKTTNSTGNDCLLCIHTQVIWLAKLLTATHNTLCCDERETTFLSMKCINYYCVIMTFHRPIMIMFGFYFEQAMSTSKSWENPNVFLMAITQNVNVINDVFKEEHWVMPLVCWDCNFKKN